MSLQLLLLGDGLALREAAGFARQSRQFTDVVEVPLETPDLFNYTMPARLADADRASTVVFAALDDAHLNLKRLTFLGELAARGLRFANIVAPGAVVADSARLMGNVFVGPRAVLGVDCKAGFGSWIGAGALIGADCELGKACTLHEGVVVGRGCRVGAGTVVGDGARLLDGCRTGRHCELRLDRVFEGEIPDRSFYQPRFVDGARIFNFRAND